MCCRTGVFGCTVPAACWALLLARGSTPPPAARCDESTSRRRRPSPMCCWRMRLAACTSSASPQARPPLKSRVARRRPYGIIARRTTARPPAASGKPYPAPQAAAPPCGPHLSRGWMARCSLFSSDVRRLWLSRMAINHCAQNTLTLPCTLLSSGTNDRGHIRRLRRFEPTGEPWMATVVDEPAEAGCPVHDAVFTRTKAGGALAWQARVLDRLLTRLNCRARYAGPRLWRGQLRGVAGVRIRLAVVPGCGRRRASRTPTHPPARVACAESYGAAVLPR